MTAPNFTILTQKELTIDLSRPAMQFLLDVIENGLDVTRSWTPALQCEIDNFRNTLLNLLERSEPKTENFDLVGE
jgi:ubiquinone biosynthesis protein UbiJ